MSVLMASRLFIGRTAYFVRGTQQIVSNPRDRTLVSRLMYNELIPASTTNGAGIVSGVVDRGSSSGTGGTPKFSNLNLLDPMPIG
jgi:hypothetical protein